MSRRRESWQREPSVESDALLTAMFGEQRRKQSIGPVSGCSARCCWPGVAPQPESQFGRAAWSWLGSPAVLMLAVLALIVAASRGLGW